MAETDMAYVGTHSSCGGWVYLGVDNPNYAKDTAKDVADLIRRGYAVSRMTVAEARKLTTACECKRKHAAASHSSEGEKG